MQPRYKLDHTCTGCGAEAIIVPAAWPGKGQVVTVPHGPGCPVERRVAALRVKAMKGAKP
jgi:hypothetical protein